MDAIWLSCIRFTLFLSDRSFSPDSTTVCTSKLLVESGLRECVGYDSLAKWADQACDGLKFIDEDYEDDTGIIRIR